MRVWFQGCGVAAHKDLGPMNGWSQKEPKLGQSLFSEAQTSQRSYDGQRMGEENAHTQAYSHTSLVTS